MNEPQQSINSMSGVYGSDAVADSLHAVTLPMVPTDLAKLGVQVEDKLLPTAAKDLVELVAQGEGKLSGKARANWLLAVSQEVGKAFSDKSVIPAQCMKSLITLTRSKSDEAFVSWNDVITLLRNSLKTYSAEQVVELVKNLRWAKRVVSPENIPTVNEQHLKCPKERIERMLNAYLLKKTSECSVEEILQIMKAARLGSFSVDAGFKRLFDLQKQGALSEPGLITYTIRELALSKDLSDASLRFVKSCIPTLSQAVPTLDGPTACELFRSLGVLHTIHYSLTPALQARIKECLPELGLRDLTRVVRGFAELGFADASLLEPLIDRVRLVAAEERLEFYELITMVWGFSIVCSSESFERVWPLAQESAAGHLTIESARLLKLASLMQSRALPAELAPKVERFFSKIEASNEKDHPPANDFERESGERVKKLGLNIAYGKHISGIEVDIVTDVPGVGPTAIFCDGVRYHHINQDASGLLSGPDKLATELVRRAGYRTVRITDTEFFAHRRDHRWMRQKLFVSREK